MREKWASIVYIAHKQKSERNSTRGQGRQQQQQPPNKLGLCLFIHTFRDTLGGKKKLKGSNNLFYIPAVHLPHHKSIQRSWKLFQIDNIKTGHFSRSFFKFFFFFFEVFFEAFRRQAIPGKIIIKKKICIPGRKEKKTLPHTN